MASVINEKRVGVQDMVGQLREQEYRYLPLIKDLTVAVQISLKVSESNRRGERGPES